MDDAINVDCIDVMYIYRGVRGFGLGPHLPLFWAKDEKFNSSSRRSSGGGGDER